MPPKKKTSDGGAGAKPTEKERLAWAEAEVASLYRLLDIKAHEARAARARARAGPVAGRRRGGRCARGAPRRRRRLRARAR
jgi:hypothetical protein